MCWREVRGVLAGGGTLGWWGAEQQTPGGKTELHCIYIGHVSKIVRLVCTESCLYLQPIELYSHLQAGNNHNDIYHVGAGPKVYYCALGINFSYYCDLCSSDVIPDVRTIHNLYTNGLSYQGLVIRIEYCKLHFRCIIIE